MATAAKKTSAKKSTAKKSTGKKAANKTVATRKTASKKNESIDLKGRVEQLLEDMKQRAETAKEQQQKAGLATLGAYGKAYDFAVEQINKAKEQRDERVTELVKRGEQVRDQAKERLDDIDMPKLNMDSLKMDSVKDSVQEQVDSLKESVEDMREKMNDSFENMKEKMTPAKA